VDGLTRILARHVAETPFAALPAAAVNAARRSLIDAVGVMLGASGLEPACAPFAEEARALAGVGESTVLGFGFRAPAAAAAFANGALAHALDYEDAYDGAPLHPNAPTAPAALAAMEAGGPCAGADLIAALALGCDVTCRLGLALTENPDEYGFYPPPMLGAFGAAAAVGRLTGLSADQMVDAFALTLSQAVATAQFKQAPDSAVRAIRDAFAAQAGVTAARLAARGVRGFDGVFEGEAGFYALYARGAYDPAVALRDLGADFLGAGVSFKPWPACRGTHAFIEAALALRAQAPADQIEKIVMRGAPMLTMLTAPEAAKKAPQTAIDAKFSLPFTVAAALAHGRVTLESFFPAALKDAAVLKLAAKAQFEIDPHAPPGMQGATSGALALHCADGRVLSHAVERPRGHPGNPLSDDDLRAKFADCAAYAKRPPSAATVRAFLGRADELAHCADASALLAGL
jgi:2-methylcitrate dehydratase PrpD